MNFKEGRKETSCKELHNNGSERYPSKKKIAVLSQTWEGFCLSLWKIMLLFNYIMDTYIIHPIVNRFFKNPFYPTNIIFSKEPLKPFFLVSLSVQLMFFIHLTRWFSASFQITTREGKWSFLFSFIFSVHEYECRLPSLEDSHLSRKPGAEHPHHKWLSSPWTQSVYASKHQVLWMFPSLWKLQRAR